MDDIKAAIKLSPNDKNFWALFEKIKKLKQVKASHQLVRCKAMFSRGFYNEKETPK